MSKSLPDRWIARIPQLNAELLWAYGLTALPRKRTPPPWVKALILRVYGSGEFRFLKETNPVSHSSVTPEMFGKLIGGGEMLGQILSFPDQGYVEEARRNPQLRAYGKKLMAQLMSQLQTIGRRKFLRRTPLPKIKTADQLMRLRDGHANGSKIAAQRRSLSYDPSITQHVSVLMLFHWEEVDFAESIPEIYNWLLEAKVARFNIKMLERLCREVGWKPKPRKRRAK
jgi:hypothetical protein